VILRRASSNPILTRADVPDTAAFSDVSSIFNPGAIEHEGSTVLVARVQTRGRRTHLLTARGRDGESFVVEPRPVTFDGFDADAIGAYHVYDPRLTRIDDVVYLTLAIDTDDGCRCGIATTEDFETFTWLGLTDDPDTRNAVLFPQRIDGAFARLDRPNRAGATGDPASGDAIVFSTSTDLLTWTPRGEVMRARSRYWDERIGSGPPPVLTDHGWLHVYHGVATHFASTNVYQAGVVLLDRDDPSRVVARGAENVLEPREPYELAGQVPNVVFPSGWTVEEPITDRSRVRVYYGVADTAIGLAESTIGELVAACGRTS
jgi:beta-1,4-mannooligosaccharide/beta-1,4-mannosyl-N-acetylglucosamine phosphorylase